MRGLTIVPGRAGTLQLDAIEEPATAQGAVLVRTLAVGVCGTDRDLIDGRFGEAPSGEERLVLGIVRHPDPLPCINCALGEWDMCRNGGFTERGIKQAHGFAAQRFRSDPEFLVKVNPALGMAAVLLEPASVLAKAWEHIERIGRRARWPDGRAARHAARPRATTRGFRRWSSTS
jgi:glucose 1-dehydrogenase